MHAILYRSTATGPVSPADIEQIADAAARRNALWSITGLLLHGPDAHGRHGFAQWIEGDAENTEYLFALICADCRHTDVTRIADGHDLVGYALPTGGSGMRATAVDCLPETVDAFFSHAALCHDASDRARQDPARPHGR